jgi:hypothetical protein
MSSRRAVLTRPTVTIDLCESLTGKRPRTCFGSDKKHKEGMSWVRRQSPGMGLIAQIENFPEWGIKKKLGRRSVAVTVLPGFSEGNCNEPCEQFRVPPRH